MPDRYDPKLSVRPPGERKTAEAASDSDPLAELARIVSGRPPFEPAPAGKGRAVASAPPPEPDVERDLEAELLNDLQASFAAIREPLENAGAAVPDPQPEPPLPQPPLRAAAEPPPSRPPEARSEPPPRRPDPLAFDISQAFEEAAFVPASRPAPRPEPPKSYISPTRGPAAPQNRGELPVRAGPPALRPPPARNDQAPVARGEPVPPRLDRPASPQPRADKPSLLRRVVGPPRADHPNLPVRPLPEAEESRAAELPTAPRTSPPKPVRAEPAPLPSRFAPPKATVAPPPPPRRQAAPEPVVQAPAEDDFELADLAGELEGPFEDEFTLDDLEAYGSDDEFPPFPEEELASLRRRRTGRVFAVIAGLMAIVAIGGAAVFLYRSDAATGGPPPIIAADSGPTKVPPDEPTAAETDPQGKLIYDRVDGSADGSETTLVTSGEAEIGDIPATDADAADNPISRVIIPGGPGVDSPVPTDGAGEAVIAEAEPPATEDSDIGPRMVRTVVVKPDGTIVSSEATGVDEDGNALPQPEESDVAVTLPEPDRSEMDAVLEGGDLAVNPDPLNAQTTDEPAAAADAAPAEAPPPQAEPEAIPTPPVEAEVPPALRTLPTPQPEPVAAAPEPAAPPPPQEQTIVATRGSADGPIDLTPGTAPAAGPAQSAGGVLVQVTAVRSEQEAVSAYRGLQQRYPSILGAFQPNIVRADLGDRGIYYRVRVGPFSGGDATRLCEDLKAAGADCILAR